MVCSACSANGHVLTSGMMYLAAPIPYTGERIRHVLQGAGLAVVAPQPNVIAAALDTDALTHVIDGLAAALTTEELEGTRALVLDGPGTPGLADFLRGGSLAELVAQVRNQWLATLLADERLVTHFQPIVESARPERLFAHECLTRGNSADGQLIPPVQLYAAATASKMVFALDRAARIAAIHGAARHGLDGRIFINFTPSSIYNPAFCLRSTAQAVQEAGIAPERIVFEVVESEEIRDQDHLIAILDVYRRNGYGIALDDVGSGFASLSLLARLEPDYIKLDMSLTRGIDTNPVKAILAAKLLEAASELGIETIAEGVETIEEWQWCRDHGATYQQGYLFARPAAPPLAPQRIEMGVAAGA